MANIDYVLVGPGPSSAEVRDAVQRASDSDLTESGWLHPADQRAALHVIGDPSGSGHVVQVYYSGDPVAARHELARKVYDSLAATTVWDLVLDSDDTEDIIAERSKLRT